jgi:hypothetical protein
MSDVRVLDQRILCAVIFAALREIVFARLSMPIATEQTRLPK